MAYYTSHDYYEKGGLVMYSRNVNLDLLYAKYMQKLIIAGIYRGYIVYIDTHNKMVYNTNGQAVLQFRR